MSVRRVAGVGMPSISDDRPLLYDVFSGAGGAGMGYARAGFRVVGIDVKPQPRYPFEHIQMDAFEFFGRVARGEYEAPAAWHCSPPCQAYSSLKAWNPHKKGVHPELIEPTREELLKTGLPYVIENVVGSPLNTTILLCGSAFGLRVLRHRLFESNVMLFGKPCDHAALTDPVGVYGDHPEDAMVGTGTRIRRARSLVDGQDAMGVDWMKWKELTQSIPPAYTEYIGRQLMAAIQWQKDEAA